MSERRAGLENRNAQADPTDMTGKADMSWEASVERTRTLRRDIGGGMHNKGVVEATREALQRDRT
jgi:hypothetical protein